MIAALVFAAAHFQIGNYMTSVPNGIAFIANDKDAFVMDPGGTYFAGAAAPDDSYHRSVFTQNDVRVEMEWSKVGNNVIGILHAEKPIDVKFDLTKNWPDWESTFEPTKDGIEGHGKNGTKWTLRSAPVPINAGPKSIEFHVTPDVPAVFEAGGSPRSADLKSIKVQIEQAMFRYSAHKPRATDGPGDFLGAIADNLNNSRVYSNDNKMTAITVSRGWASTPNTAPYFCWDSFFNGALACLDDPEMAKDTVRAILSWQTKEGFVPNFGHWNFESNRVSDDRSQPPVGALCVWKMHQRHPDTGFLKEIYPKLLKWHRWWPQARDGRHDGLLEWGSSKKGMQEALWETGWDDTVHFQGAKVAGTTLDAYAIDLNSMWVMDAEYLALIADAIGKKQDAQDLRDERDRTAARINEKLWNPDLGIYCSRLWDGTFLTRLTPMNFYPLIAGIPTAPQAEQMLHILIDPHKFWGDWLLPTVAYDDPVWSQQDYWKGKVWAPVNFLVFQGLLRYANPEITNEFAAKSVGLFMRNWVDKGVCGENYLSSTGAQSSDPHYTWGALLCLVNLENTVAQMPDGRIRLNGTLNTVCTLTNVPLAGRTYTVLIQPGLTQIRDGRLVVMEARNQVLMARMPNR